MPFARFNWIPGRWPGAAAEASDARRLFLAAVVNAALFAFVLSALTLSYETNDDVGLGNIASGLISGKPSGELVFTNILIGTALSHLYQWTDRVNWYTFYLLAVHLAVMTGLLFAFLRIHFSLLSVALFVLLFLQYEVGLLLWLTYTSAGVMAAVVGALLLAGSSSGESGPSRLAIGYGGPLIVLAGLMRADSLYYALIVIAPFLAYRLACSRRWRPLVATGVFLGVALAAIGLNDWHYRSDPRWSGFHAFSAGLSAMLDTQSIDYNEKTRVYFDRVGWTATDWQMLRSWFAADPKVFTTERMRKLMGYFRETHWRRPGPWVYLEDRLLPLIALRRMTYANLLLAFLLCAQGRLRLVLVGGFQGLWVSGLFLYMAAYWKIEPRVAMPAAFALAIIVFELAIETARARRLSAVKSAPSRLPRWALAGGILAFSLCYGFACYRTASHHWAQSQFNRRSQTAYRSLVRMVIDRYVAKDPDAIFFSWGAIFPFDFTPPFDTNRQPHLQIVPLGWSQHSPLFEDRLRQLGLRDFCHAVYENPHVYVFMPVERVGLLERFIREHYGQEIVPKRIDILEVGDGEQTVRTEITLPVVQMTARAKSTAQTPPVRTQTKAQPD